MQHADRFKIRHNSLPPQKGAILIAEPFLREFHFQRAVILLVKHGEQGSMGFVLNKKTTLRVNDFLDGTDNCPDMPVFLGGPILSNRLFFIHSLGDIIPESIRIEDNLYFNGDFRAIRQYLASGRPVDGQIKFFLGYAGWTENQLAGEIQADAWLVSHAPSRDILHAEGEAFWKQTVKSLGNPYLTWLNYPKNPILN
jgi:putative transcriptional regulator